MEECHYKYFNINKKVWAFIPLFNQFASQFFQKKRKDASAFRRDGTCFLISLLLSIVNRIQSNLLIVLNDRIQKADDPRLLLGNKGKRVQRSSDNPHTYRGFRGTSRLPCRCPTADFETDIAFICACVPQIAYSSVSYPCTCAHPLSALPCGCQLLLCHNTVPRQS